MSYERKPTFKSIVVSIIVLLIGLGIGSVVSGGKQKSIIQQLERICAQEKLGFDNTALELIAAQAKGSCSMTGQVL